MRFTAVLQRLLDRMLKFIILKIHFMVEETPRDATPPSVISGQASLAIKFDISPKSSNAWLVEQKTRVTYDYAAQLGNDILANAMELEPGVPWGEILNSIIWIDTGKRYQGKSAIQRASATTIGSVARTMGWNMDSPEVVYMSIHAIILPLSVKIAALNQDLSDIEAGRNKFETEEAKVRRVEEVMQRVRKLGVFDGKLRESAEAYADQFLPQDPVNRKVLRRILMTGHDSTTKQRLRALTQMQHGNWTAAEDVLSKLTFKGWGSSQ